MAVVTLSEIRGIVGIDSTGVTDDAISNVIIPEVISNTYSYFGVSPTPIKKIEVIDGNNKATIKLNSPYLLKIEKLTLGDDDVNLENVEFNMYSSIVRLNREVSPYYFYERERYVKVKYLSAFMEKDIDAITETTTDETAGSSVVISVDDATNFSVNDWILIEGTDANIEAAKITSISSNDITVDRLVQTHSSGSVVTKLNTHNLLKKFILHECAIYAASNATGNSYTFNTGYSKGGASFQKGVPYTHFQKVVEDNIKQRDSAKNQIFNLIGGIS